MNQKTSIYHYSNNYGNLSNATRLRVAVNMTDPTCLLETVRPLMLLRPQEFFFFLFIHHV